MQVHVCMWHICTCVYVCLQSCICCFSGVVKKCKDNWTIQASVPPDVDCILTLTIRLEGEGQVQPLWQWLLLLLCLQRLAIPPSLSSELPPPFLPLVFPLLSFPPPSYLTSFLSLLFSHPLPLVLRPYLAPSRSPPYATCCSAIRQSGEHLKYV